MAVFVFKSQFPRSAAVTFFVMRLLPFRYIEGYSKRLKIGLGFGTTSGKVEIHAMRFAYMRDTEELLYYQFPQFLLEISFSSNTRIVYCLLYDRERISRKNQWLDEQGRVEITKDKVREVKILLNV